MSDPRDYVIKKTEDTNYIILTESSDIEHHSLSRKTLNLRQRKQPQSYRCKLHTFSYKFIFWLICFTSLGLHRLLLRSPYARTLFRSWVWFRIRTTLCTWK